MINVTTYLFCIVRSVNERTATACFNLLAEQIGSHAPADIIVVGGKPFPDTLADSLQAGLDANREWTLCVDADVLPLPGAVPAFLEYAADFDEATIEIQGLIYDRFFGGWRGAGMHLYRTQHLPQALKRLPEVRQAIRPEYSLLLKLKEDGLHWHQTGFAFGLHDFAQHPDDIARTCFVHAWKHVALIPRCLDYWRLRRAEADFAAALQGLAAGILYDGTIRLDRQAAYYPKLGQSEPLGTLTADTVLEWLEHDHAQVRALGYQRGPVIDWPNDYWNNTPRQQALAASMTELVAQGIRRVRISGDNPKTAEMLRAAAERVGIQVSSAVPWWADPTATGNDDPLLSWTACQALQVRTTEGRCLRIASAPPQIKPSDYPRHAEHLMQQMLNTGVARCMIYGTGDIGQAVHTAAAQAGLTVLAFIESSPTAPQQQDIPILPPEAAVAEHGAVDIVMASVAAAQAIGWRLLQLQIDGLSLGRIWVFGRKDNTFIPSPHENGSNTIFNK